MAVCRVRAGVARRSLIWPRYPAIRLDIDHLAWQYACWSRGTLVLLDDLHWADEETPAVFDHLADNRISATPFAKLANAIAAAQPSTAAETVTTLRPSLPAR